MQKREATKIDTSRDSLLYHCESFQIIPTHTFDVVVEVGADKLTSTDKRRLGHNPVELLATLFYMQNEMKSEYTGPLQTSALREETKVDPLIIDLSKVLWLLAPEEASSKPLSYAIKDRCTQDDKCNLVKRDGSDFIACQRRGVSFSIL